MKKTKKSRKNQQYEQYWKLTMEYTKFESENFNITLKMIVDYIDKYQGNITSEIYRKLQDELNVITPKSDMRSIRKAINQFLKLGFINNGMKSYHKKTKDFLLEKDISRKKRIYSEILYDNASFSRSYTNETDERELNFLLKTLEYCGSLTKENLLALMFQNVNNYSKGYVNLDELSVITEQMMENNGIERKYNQLAYLYNICKNILSGVYVNKEKSVTLDKDERAEEFVRKGRDPYKQRLYKYDLYRESIDKNGNISCYLEGVAYPSLVASHIKPYINCSEEEQFDVENGLLLSRNMDLLFDQGWISFTNEGEVICSDNLDEELKNILSSKNIEKKYLNSEKRLEYLKYHRENVFNKSKINKMSRVDLLK